MKYKNGLTLQEVIVILAIIMVFVAIVVRAVNEMPIVMRGYEKYGVVMQPSEVLRLEALEKIGDTK